MKLNTTDPCDPDYHYMLPPKDRLVGAQLHRYIRDRLYWVLHAPRQTGKTTFLQSWMRKINQTGVAIVCYVSVERCQEIGDTERSMPAICEAINQYAKDFDVPIPRIDDVGSISMLSNILHNWSELVAPKPAHLFAQRTAENGQQITREALDYVYEQSRRQPWIVNSLFKRVTLQIMDKQSVETAELKHFIEAREKMIMARETHLDALAYRLKGPGIRGVIEPILTGESDPDLAEGEAFRLCQDLGLVALERGTPKIANPIYREVIARHLTYGQQLAIPEPNWQWEKPDGSLYMDKMMQEFQKLTKESLGNTTVR